MPKQVFEFPGQPDFELQSDRSSPVKMIAEIPEGGEADGLVFVIPGMGGDKDSNYSEMIRRYISSKYNLVAVSVDAHCNTCRPQRSTEFGDVGVSIVPFSVIDALGKYVSLGGVVDAPLKTHDDIISLLRRDKTQTYGLKATLTPPGGQYQNFGVLSALDHVCALHFLIDSDVRFDPANVVCLGSSHGGYIAHMINKLAPNTINGVIEASAYTETLLSFVDGKWNEHAITDGNIIYACSTVQKWQFEKHGDPTFFGPDRALIRDTSYSAHLAEIATKTERPCQFRMIHSATDRISPLHLKSRQARHLVAQGFDVRLDVVHDADVDGKFVKSTDHGMGIALNQLFDIYYPTLSKRAGKLDRERKTSLTFEGVHMRYEVQYEPRQLHVAATCHEIDAPEA